jgi:hypothetical protein
MAMLAARVGVVLHALPELGITRMLRQNCAVR